MLRRPPRSTLFPTRRSSDLSFTMNFDWAARHSGEMFRDTLDAAKRSAGATRAWIDERTLVGDKDRKSTRLNSSHVSNSYAVFCLKKKIIDIASVLLTDV